MIVRGFSKILLKRHMGFAISLFFKISGFFFFLVLSVLTNPNFATAALTDAGQEQPIDLEADVLTHDENNQIITATGHVEFVQAGRILKADSVTYNLQTDRVRATGNVVLSEVDGTTYFADDVELTDDMKDGFANGLQILLADGARFTAMDGTRTQGTVIELKQATYTPCTPCKEDPTRPPLWQIRAAEVRHDEADKSISYKDVWFEFAGVPLAYTPYFSHPDGTEKQKSGFLSPSVGFNSDLGASYQQEYYWAIGPDKDATLGVAAYSDTNPLALGEYRQRFDNAVLNVNASATYSDRTDLSAGVEREIKDEFRGHLFGDVLWDINDEWRSGLKTQIASDDQYLRQYDIPAGDVLESEIYAERFSGRNYVVGRALAFQDVRIRSRQEEQPGVLPEIIASFYGDPNQTLGGRWNLTLSALGLYREGNGQDVGRTSIETGWQRRYVTGFGLVNKIDALMRGDFYATFDRTDLSNTSDENTTKSRGFAQANWEASYPMVKRYDQSQVTLSPLFSLTAGTNVDFLNEIPNEDSQGFSLDSTNLFEPNRSPGYDLIEDRSRATYGLRTGWYGDGGNQAEIFIGQSWRFEDSDNPFTQGSGLSEQESDYVGQITSKIGTNFDFDYSFQLDSDSFASQRHQLNTNLNWDRYEFGMQYFYARSIEGSELNTNREQIKPSLRVRLYDDWYASGFLWYDLGKDSGLRQTRYGIDYLGQCMTFALTTERTLTTSSSGDSGTQIMARIGLKNLGEFQTSGIKLGDEKNDDSDIKEEQK